MSGTTSDAELPPLPKYIGTAVAQGDAVDQLHGAIVSESSKCPLFYSRSSKFVPTLNLLNVICPLRLWVAVHSGEGSVWCGPANREPDQADPDFAVLCSQHCGGRPAVADSATVWS